MSDSSNLESANFCRGVISVLVERLGPEPVVITQEQLDFMHGTVLHEVSVPGKLTLTLESPKGAN